ncbi:McrB family protein [Aeromonas dhakensis]|uniref:McrB family protein n=1 Tax=Aeromonas dhakensis TaxID=196024 RepID=UPI00237894D0|nr:AAA family ATPase [Aeromonas dhakensis]MDD9210364.1 AAA family ATPase [Aeromonas dhakensis]
MSNFQEQYFQWDEFLSIWPASRLVKMTLDEYSKAGSKESFTYWIESGLDELGSIWGGSAFKFGVFSRKNTEDKSSDSKLSYSDTHGWYSSLGTTADEAFEKVRGFVVQVVNWAANGDLEAIDAFEQLGEAFKWKIAFHYQNRQSPVIVPIFKPAWLASYLGVSASQGMGVLQKAALAKRPSDLGILEFGRQVWEVWSQKNLAIWKLSHGVKDFSVDELQQCLEAGLAVMHGETAKGQGKEFQEVPVGTLFYLCHGNESLPLVGQFISVSEPCDTGDGWVQRRYRVLKQAIKQGGYQDGKKGWTPNYNSTFKQVPAHDLPEFEAALLKPFFGTDLAELATLAGESMDVANTENAKMPGPVTAATQVTKQPVANCFNRIYYGPPGTGKTYTLMQLLKRDYETQALAISADQWRSQIIAEKVAMLTWWEVVTAALYELGGQATVSQLLEHPFVQAVSARSANQNRRATLWVNLQAHTIEESKTVNYKRRSAPFIFDKSPDSIWQFAGDWQETCADLIELVETFRKGPQAQQALQRYSFVTFHQSYGYEEFVEGLRPVLNGDGENGEVEYEIRPGVFKELCRKARQSPDQRFAMVIDEINRGNISKIFGELITLIESDKRDPLNGNSPPLELTLAYSGEKFSVPANVDIIGTMNTADRSLALLDTALRRRFDFVPLLPDTRAEKSADDPHSAPLAGLQVITHKGTIDVRRMLERINERIESLYDRDHCIGHAYFTSLSEVADGSTRFDMLADVFRKRIVPLLEEYFFEDWHKIRLVLGDNQKSDAEQFITESDAHEQDLIELFGNDHGLDCYATKHRYQAQPSALVNPAAYIGIYQSTV